MSAVDVLVDQYQQGLDAQQAQARREHDALVAELLRQLPDMFGDAWTELAPYLSIVDNGGGDVKFVFQAEKLRLMSIYVSFDGYKRPNFFVNGNRAKDLQTMLWKARTGYPEWHEKWMWGRIDKLARQVGQAATEEQAREYAAAWALIDGQGEAAKLAVAQRVAQLERMRKQTEDEKARQVLVEAEKERFGAACLAYERERARAVQNNREVRQRLQDLLDQPFIVYELAYAVAVLDDTLSGSIDPILDVCRVYVTDPKPDPGGWWEVYSRGKTISIRYQNLVSVEALEVRPGQCTVAAQCIELGGEFVFARPGEDVSELVNEHAALLIPLPEEPIVNMELLDYYDVELIRQRVHDQMREEWSVSAAAISS